MKGSARTRTDSTWTPDAGAEPEPEREQEPDLETGPETGPETRPASGPEPSAGSDPAHDAADGADAGPDAEEPVTEPRRRRWPWPRLRLPGWRTWAALATAVLLVAGAGLLYGARQLTHVPAADNHALTDTEATSQVTGDVSSALARVFSYTPDGTAATERSARELLAGKAAHQYADLFGRLRAQVAEQKVTLSTRVVRAGVVRLTGDSAELLVFLDQTTRRDGKHPATAAAQLSVTAQLRDGQWLIVDIRAR